MRIGRLKTYVFDVRKHPLYYASWVFLLFVGLSCGYSSMIIMGETDGASLIASINHWLEGFVYGKSAIGDLLLSALLTHGRWLCLIVLSGLFRFGSPFVFIVPAVKGYGMGVVAGMLRVAYGFRGLLLSLAVLSVQNLFLIPCFAYAGSVALGHIQIRVSKHKGKLYFKNLMPAFIFFFIALIIESTLMPLLIGWLGGSYV